MSTIEQRRIYTPEDLLALPDSVSFELVDGELVERNSTVLSSMVDGLVAVRLQIAAQAANAGEVWPGSLGYRCYANAPDRIRKPDASFVRRERFSPDLYGEEFMPIRPDIAVEVISKNDLAVQLEAKIEEYLEAGVPLVWVVYPESRTVQIHRADNSISRLRESDVLTGEEIFPAFRCRVAEFFPKSST